MTDAEGEHSRLQFLGQFKLATFFLGLLVIFASGVILRQLQAIVKPLLMAIFLSLIFEPMVKFFTRLKIPKFLAIVISLIIVFAVLWSLGVLIFASVASFTEGFPKYADRFRELYLSTIQRLEIPHEQVQAYLQQVKWADVWKDLSLTRFISSLVGTFINFLTNLFFVLILTLYIVLGKQHMASKIQESFPGERADRISRVFGNINRGVQRYLITKTVISLATGLLAYLILLIFGIDFALVWGLLTFLLNYIPGIGSVIATLPPIFVAFVQHGSPFPAVWVALLLIGTQSTMGNFIEPRAMGKSMNLSPLVVILSLVFWGFIWGPIGMVLAVPISSTIQIVCVNIEALKPVGILMEGK